MKPVANAACVYMDMCFVAEAWQGFSCSFIYIYDIVFACILTAEE